MSDSDIEIIQTAPPPPNIETTLLQQAAFGVSYYWNRAQFALGSFNWFDRVDTHVILGALPQDTDLTELTNAPLNVSHIINMCQETEGVERRAKLCGLTHYRLPCPDFNVPPYEHLVRGAEILNAVADKGETALVHCKAGKGRSASVVMCYLVTRYQLDLEGAQNLLLEKRKQVEPNLKDAIAIRLFYENLKNKDERKPFV
ncbi:hypothetical protein SmJEL517_g03380 [Synchytrium microbalum]|uniref:Uncharacterized protein n=1 Tax=Synchytrium microbalum TaxID=1806994 RepID=A0A507C7E5_9FUNG|nr:uncharacterized protein SmJEL517_g03380 [Synchytrium microbalum]TPX33916.1 hypothetical protein SmJEL517_g03380 [Synchytrium microbalum]